MGKIFWVMRNKKMVGASESDGLSVINKYLADGWREKAVSACAVGSSINHGQAYIVIERD